MRNCQWTHLRGSIVCEHLPPGTDCTAGPWGWKSSLPTLNTLHQVIVKSILTSWVACGASDTECAEGTAERGRGNAILTSITESCSHDDQNIYHFSKKPFSPFLVLSCLILSSPKIKWMTYIQLSDLLVPFQWLESLKIGNISTNVFPDGGETLIDQPIWFCHSAVILPFVRVDQ